MVPREIGHYQLLEKIGEGSFGEVHRARDLSLDRTVVIKTLKSRFESFHQIRARFQREAEAISSIDHPNVVTLYEFIRDEDSLHLVMQWVDGETLRERQAKGPLPLGEITRVIAEIASGLEAAHAQGVTHRDLKPANILLTRSGQCKIVDFGLAHFGERTTLAGQSDLLGTPAYMAPEQQLGGVVDARTDIYSLGLMLEEMLDKLDSVPRRLQQVAKRATHHDPADRYRSAAEMRADLEGHPAMPAWVGVAVVVALVLSMGWPRISDYLRGSSSEDEPKRILVAPFQNVTRNEDLEWLSTAIMDNFMGVLGQMEGYRLVSRETIRSAMQQAQVRAQAAGLGGLRLRELAEDVAVDYVVSGNYSKFGDGLRINCALEDFRKGEVIASWPRDLHDIDQQLLPSIDGLSRGIAQALGATLAAADDLSPRFHTDNIVALREFEEGMQYLRADETAKAINRFQAAVEADSAYARAWLYLWRTVPDPDAQDDSIRRAMHYRHGTPPPLEALIEAAFAEHDGTDEEAIARYEELLAKWPDEPLIHNSLAGLYLRGRRYHEAIGEFEATRTLNPYDYSFAVQLVAAYAEEGRTGQARAILVEWRKDRPREEGAPRQLIRLATWTGAYDEALAWCDTLGVLAPGTELGHRSVVFRYQGRGAAAEDQLLQWSRQREGRYMRAMPLMMLADLDRVRGYLDRGKERIDTVLDEQDNYYSRWVAGQIAVSRGELDLADAHAAMIAASIGDDLADSTAVNAFGYRRFYCDLAGKIALARGETAEAVQWHRLARRFSSRLDANTFLPPLGDAALAAGDTLAARKAWTDALSLNPNSSEPLLALGRLALIREDPEVARVPLERLDSVWSEADPEFPQRVELDQLLAQLPVEDR